MPRCPQCGSWVWGRIGSLERRVCAHCGVVLKLKGGLDGFLFGDLEPGSHLDHLRTTRKDHRGIIDFSEEPASHLDRTRKDQRGVIILPENGVHRQTEELETPEGKPSLKGGAGERGLCSHCGAVIMPSNANFCSSCGASLGHGLDNASPVGMKEKAKPGEDVGSMAEQVEECMVCNLSLDESDNVMWCPHCGNPAHRSHLLEWLHARKYCPVCRERLTEQEIE